MVALFDAQIALTINATSPTRDKTGLSQMATTGSITAASDQLVVADALDFRIGDWVIVEIGGEAGAGARGTKGVGGVWPALSYADATAMHADTSQTDRKMCWLEDTGDCWWWSDGTNAYDTSGTPRWIAITNVDYYIKKAVPKALWAEITDISGTTLTLSKTATVTATNANVYFDNWGIIQSYIDAETTLYIPAGTYHVSDHNVAYQKANITITGSGKTTAIIKSPQGASNGGLVFDNSNAILVQDFTLQNNFKNTGFGFRWADGRAVDAGLSNENITEFYRPAGNSYGGGIRFYICYDCEVRNFKALNVAQYAVGGQYVTNLWAYNCSSVLEDPLRRYIQWQFVIADSGGEGPGGFVDCDIDSAYITAGFETFRSTGVEFIRCSATNATWSFNTSDGVVMTDCSVTLEANSQYDSNSFSASNPIINSNANIGSGFSTVRNVITNFTCIQEGNVNGSGDMLIGFSAVAGTAPTDFVGTYLTDFVTPKGLFDAQGAGGADGFDGLAIRTNSIEVTATGMRFKGTQPDSPLKSHAYTEGTGTIVLTDCVIDPGNNGVGTVTELGTIYTNAEYDAL